MQLLSCLLLKAWSIPWLASLSTNIFERVARQKPHTVPGRCGGWTIWPLDLGSWNPWSQDRCKILRCQETEKDQKVYDLNPRSTKVKKLLSDAGGAECLWWDFGRQNGFQAMLFRFQTTLWDRAVQKACSCMPKKTYCSVVYCIVFYCFACVSLICLPWRCLPARHPWTPWKEFLLQVKGQNSLGQLALLQRPGFLNFAKSEETWDSNTICHNN